MPLNCGRKEEKYIKSASLSLIKFVKTKSHTLFSNKMKTVIFLSTVIISIQFTNCTTKQKPQKRPNILFAISDDQTYLHTSFAGAKFINTPAFDRVASEEVYFNNCLAGSPGCTPSRSTITTGRYH